MDQQNLIEEKIRHLLRIYPVVNPSMLQSLMGSCPAKVWRQALQHLEATGEVIQDQTITVRTPADRYLTYKRIYLADMRPLLDATTHWRNDE